MPLILTVSVVMVAFAANSILNRLGVAVFGADPFVFAAIRVAAGAAMLVILTRGALAMERKRIWGGLALAVYMFGFSWAYLQLDAGLGALILFGTVQLCIFLWALAAGQKIAVLRWIGALVALSGLALLLWPAGDVRTPIAGALAMAIAGAGWAAYTLLGQGAPRPLEATAGNFVVCLPIVLIPLAWIEFEINVAGTITAIVAGAITSGLGYALWYRVLPRMEATAAGVVQLSVPVIAIVGGTLLLAEEPTARMLVAGALVLGGIAISLYRTSGSKGS